jgi:hypothetical protein
MNYHSELKNVTLSYSSISLLDLAKDGYDEFFISDETYSIDYLLAETL